MFRKEELHYGGFSYKIFGWKYLTIWLMDYRNSSVVNSRFIIDVYSKLWGNKTILKLNYYGTII